MTICGNMCAHKTTYGKMQGTRGPSVKTPFVPTPSGSRRNLGIDERRGRDMLRGRHPLIVQIMLFEHNTCLVFKLC